MEYLYALIIVANTLWNNKHDNNIPYFEVNAIFKTYLECNDKIVDSQFIHRILSFKSYQKGLPFLLYSSSLFFHLSLPSLRCL